MDGKSNSIFFLKFNSSICWPRPLIVLLIKFNLETIRDYAIPGLQYRLK